MVGCSLKSVGGALRRGLPEARPPARGHSIETNLPERWSPAGDNLAWRAPYGGRSGPGRRRQPCASLNTAGD